MKLKDAPITYHARTKFIDTERLAELLRVTKKAAERMCREGRMQEAGVGVAQTVDGGKYHILLSDIESRIGNSGTATTAEAAERLGVTATTIRRWLKEGRLAGIGIGAGRGKTWRVSNDAIETLIKER